MFSRHVSMHLKPNTRAQFIQTIENRFFPCFGNSTASRTKSFRRPRISGTEGVAISLWDKKEDAASHLRGSYPEVLKVLAKVVDGTPEVRNVRGSHQPWKRPRLA